MRITLALAVALCAMEARAATITVTGSTGRVLVWPDTTVTVTINGAAGTPKDWVGLFRLHATDQTYTSWKYVSSGTQNPGPAGVTTATLTFTLPAPGEYNFRLFRNDGFTREGMSEPISVTGDFIKVPCSPPAPLTAEQAAVAQTRPADADALSTDGYRVRMMMSFDLPEMNPSEPAITRARSDLRRGACSSGAAIIGTVRSRRTLMTDNRLRLWSEYEIDVDQVVRPGLGLTIGQRIKVTRNGGAVCVESGTINFFDQYQAPLADAARYLLFLSRVGNTSQFASSDYDWRVQDWRVSRAQTGSLVEAVDMSGAALITEAMAAQCE